MVDFIALDLGLHRDRNLASGADGEEWQVHGAGVYHIQKYLVAPERMPEDLVWFKWESYVTWLSGFARLVLVYYLEAEFYLVDSQVMDLPIWGHDPDLAAVPRDHVALDPAAAGRKRMGRTGRGAIAALCRGRGVCRGAGHRSGPLFDVSQRRAGLGGPPRGTVGRASKGHQRASISTVRRASPRTRRPFICRPG